jgi:hypothetical protein
VNPQLQGRPAHALGFDLVQFALQVGFNVRHQNLMVSLPPIAGRAAYRALA